MDFVPSSEELLIQATFRRLSEQKLATWAADADRVAAPPDALFTSVPSSSDAGAGLAALLASSRRWRRIAGAATRPSPRSLAR